MGWRFRKTIKLAPGIKLNVGKKGITSATLGKRGASINIGSKGAYTNIGIPGTGLSYRKKIKSSGVGSVKASKINQLEKLERLYNNGNISDSEYQQLRADILGYTYSENETKKKGCLASLWTLIKWFFLIIFLMIGYSIYDENQSSKKDNAVKPINQPTPNTVPVNTVPEKIIEKESIKENKLNKVNEDGGKKGVKTLDNLF